MGRRLRVRDRSTRSEWPGRGAFRDVVGDAMARDPSYRPVPWSPSKPRLWHCAGISPGICSVGDPAPACLRCSRPSASRRLRRLAQKRPPLLTTSVSACRSCNSGGNDDEKEKRDGGELVRSGRDGGEGRRWEEAQRWGRQRGAEERGGEMTVRVHFSVRCRCHSHQVLCIGGSQFPFGWSFVSIAKIPMTWNPNDIWTAEVELPVGLRLDYKYVILEEQVWTKQEDGSAEGVVDLTYRSGTEPGYPPDVHTIRKQMAIVDWQPGPNRVVQVPTKEELSHLRPGNVVQRAPAQPKPFFTFDQFRDRQHKNPVEVTGDTATWEELAIDNDGMPILTRQDVWGYTSHLHGSQKERHFGDYH